MSKIEIIPAILPRDFTELEDKISQVSGLVKTVQIDVCDGQLTPQASWPYRKPDESFKKLINEEEGLPFWKELNFEIDLMANHPAALVQDWISAGAQRIIIHYEADKKEVKSVMAALEKINGVVETGLALDIETPNEVINDFKNKIQFIQCMGIDNIGFQGQNFDTKVIAKIKSLKAMYPDLPVSVDGGVNLDNASDLIAAGATRLVVGSAIFESDNIYETIQKFKRFSR